MQPAFECARYKDGSSAFNVYCDDITPISYKQKYKGHLYCPNSECGAEIVYVSASSNGNRAFFRCECLDSHNPTCSYKKYKARSRIDIQLGDIPKYFKEDQIQNALNSKFRKNFLYPEIVSIPPDFPPSGPHREITTRYNIKYYSAFDIHDAIIRKIAIVGGYVRNLDKHRYSEDNKHAYVNLIGSEPVIGVLLSENQDAYRGEAKMLIDRIDEMMNSSHDGFDIACVAFGDVGFAPNGNGIRIRLASLKHVICKCVPKIKP